MHLFLQSWEHAFCAISYILLKEKYASSADNTKHAKQIIFKNFKTRTGKVKD